MLSTNLERTIRWATVLFVLTSFCVAGASPLEGISLRVRVARGDTEMSFSAESAVRLSSSAHQAELSAGAYRIVLKESTPPELRYHVFVKTFLPGERKAEREFLEQLEAKGVQPEIVVQGREIETGSGRILDTRMRLVSAGQFDSQGEAETFKAKLAEEEQWSWVQHAVAARGEGQILLRQIGGKTYGPLALPVTLASDGPLRLENIDTGYWNERRTSQDYTGELEISLDTSGKLMAIERLPIEDYLRGVLPAEMPAEWPLEALKAQAVAARSEVLVNASQKHFLEGYDFCGTEHCRAYLGSGHREARSDRALDETRGRFLTHGDAVVPTVFSATCGGWTEDNEVVWSGRPQPALRGLSDTAKRSASPSKTGVAKWLGQRSKAYCSGDAEYFRWTRSFTTAELTAIVNHRIGIGSIRDIETGERGVSGRLKWVKVIGTEDTKNVYKELPIRQLFGGLPSALFVVDHSGGVFTFRGAGRGHGVGLCQNGARGMAASGARYKRILTHYFSGAAIETYR